MAGWIYQPQINHQGEEDRRLQAALQQLRKEHQEMQEAVARARADAAGMRQRLAAAEMEAGRHQHAAAHAYAEGGNAAAQVQSLRARVAGEACDGEGRGCSHMRGSPHCCKCQIL